MRIAGRRRLPADRGGGRRLLRRGVVPRIEIGIESSTASAVVAAGWIAGRRGRAA
jgi:hypothetical protein